MRLALKEAEKAAAIDEVPIGAVIVQNGKVIARAHNLKEKKMQSTAHAEMLAIQKASRKLNNYYLDDNDPNKFVAKMGAEAIYDLLQQLDLDSLSFQVRNIKRLNHHPNVISGVLQPECAEILSSFFREKRKHPKKNRKPV